MRSVYILAIAGYRLGYRRRCTGGAGVDAFPNGQPGELRRERIHWSIVYKESVNEGNQNGRNGWVRMEPLFDPLKMEHQ